MNGSTRARTLRTLALGALLAALLVTPGTVAGHSPAVPPAASAAAAQKPSADIAPALGADGTFQGAPGAAGTVDPAAWTLVSNLAAGEPPRFAPATKVAPAVSPSDTGSWSALGSNGSADGALNATVDALVVSGSDLYVGGDFTNAAGIQEADYIAKWDGNAWSALGSNGAGDGALNYGVVALAVSGPDLYVGGAFYDAAGIATADYVAKWSGSAWSALGSNGSGNGAIAASHGVWALAVSGTDLYVGGDFHLAGNGAAAHIAKWDGSTWSALGSGPYSGGPLNGAVSALAVSGTDLYVGGGFTNAAGIATADYVAKWNGSAWSALGSNGSGDGALPEYSYVWALAVSDSNLYVGGSFQNAAGIATADNIAKWNGSAWSALGSNGSGNGALYPNNIVRALAVSGSNLYVGGMFGVVGIPASENIAKWNGSAWSALGSGPYYGGALNGSGVFALAVSGDNLNVGGAFTNAAGIATADNIAKWSPGSVPPVVVRKPDGRIRLGTSGAYIGNNVYNTTGAGQTKTGSAKKGKTVTFGISIQNDGNAADSFKVKATGTAASKFTVKYYAGSTDITAKVVAGTYKTASLAKGAAALITAKVTIKTTAKAGSKVTRLVTITSVGSSSKKDAVKFIAKRS